MSKKVPRIEPTRANRPRNAFDLSQKHLFTVSPGMLLPVMCVDLMPHDHIEIQATDFMRAMPMNSAAFISMRGVYEFFFVPYSQMWHGFDQLITGMNDYKSVQISTVFNGKSPEKVPAVSLGDLAKFVVQQDSSDIFGYSNKYNIPRLLDMLGYGRVTDINGALRDEIKNISMKVTPFRLAAYQKIYQDHYRNTTYESTEVDQFNFDNFSRDFGVDVSEGRDGRCHYIGGFDSNVQVGDVTQQSGTTVTSADAEFGGYLGRTVGKATSKGSGSINYDAKEHGILMCIYSLIPDMQYDSTRVDPFVTKQKRTEFFVPEFENLGLQLQPVASVSDKVNISSAFGFQPRYSEYKTALDINHGQFIAGAPLEYWSIGRARAGDTLKTFNIASLKINPRWIDDVFAVNYNGKELTDSFFGGCTFRIQKVSDMSEDGMPRV